MAKTLLVTGGAKGIGRAIAIRFAVEGYNIILNYRSSLPDGLINEIEGKGVSCEAVRADVSNFKEAESLVKKAKERFGGIDVLVNNAGIIRDGLLIRMSEADFDEVININLKGAFNMTRHVSSLMLKQKSGSIINISSVVGITGNLGQANYAASKAGLIGLTKSTAKELASRSVTCNAVAPGFIETDMTDTLSEEIHAKLKENIPLKRLGSADEVADLVYFLANSKYITGQVVNIDGGMVI